jgi:uncharacterized membrane protein (DUF485 family)
MKRISLMMKKLLARNDEANPEIVLPIAFLSIFMGFILTGMAVVLATQSEQRIAFVITSVLAVCSWASIALLSHKYSRITM